MCSLGINFTHCNWTIELVFNQHQTNAPILVQNFSDTSKCTRNVLTAFKERSFMKLEMIVSDPKLSNVCAHEPALEAHTGGASVSC